MASFFSSVPMRPRTIQGYAAPVFKTPDQFSGLLMWQRSDSGITQALNVVSNWSDRSGNENNLLQSTAGAQPTFSASDASFNGLPSLTFDGVANYLITAGNVSYGAFTMFIVCTGFSTAGRYFYYHNVDGNNLDYMYGSTGNSIDVRRSSAQAAGNSSGAWGAFGATPKTLSRSFDGTAAANNLYINGALSDCTHTGIDAPGAINGPFSLFADNVGSLSAGTRCAEFIMFNRALSADERLGVEAYLRNRYRHY